MFQKPQFNSLITPRFPKLKVNWQIILVALLVIVFTAGCQSRQKEIVAFDQYQDLSNQEDIVVLLHGMYRSEVAMRPVERFFKDQDYQVVNLSYPSTEYDIETLVADYLKPAIDGIELTPGQKLHFVTHSMGGILVRYYLKQYPQEQLGRVVMIAPPNQGTELADLFGDSDWIDTRRGPAVDQLSSVQESWVKQLGPVEFELGVIAGNKNNNWLTKWVLPGADDGVVSVESTKVDNMKDFIEVPEKHYRLRADKVVLNQSAYFLKFGHFYKAAIAAL